MDEAAFREAESRVWEAAGAQPVERLLSLPTVGTTARVLELGEGPPAVFIHGASTGATSWASLAIRLPGVRCILLDRPGCGLSPPRPRTTEPAAVAAYADALVVDVLDALGIEDAAAVGTSYGGYFALRAAAAHPARFTRLVELGWPVGAPIESTPWLMRIGMQPFVARLTARIPPNERMVRSMLKQIGLRRAIESGRFGPADVAWFLSVLRDTDTLRNEIDSSLRIVTLRGFDASTLLPPSLLARVRVPARFLWGDEDPMGGAALARAFVDRLPDATLEMIPRAGHAPWMDEPDLIATRVREFLLG